MEEEEARLLQMRLEELQQTHEQKEGKHHQILNQRKTQAKEYTDHVQERLNLLRIIDIVKKIETENRYLQKVERIEKVRQDKDSRFKELIEYTKALQEKRLSRTLQNRQYHDKESKKKIKDLASSIKKNEES